MNEQQNFWIQEYAEEYRRENSSFDLQIGIKGWAEMLRSVSGISSLLECGSNIGRNINFLNFLLPGAKKSVIEISPEAFNIVTNQYTIERSFNGPIIEYTFFPSSFYLVFTSGVLIHIHPDDLLQNMQKMHNLSSKYILIAEYFNRTPIMIEYQGKQNRLFKRDFGKMFMENFDVKLVDYGFLWGQLFDKGGFDDLTWWLFEKK